MRSARRTFARPLKTLSMLFEFMVAPALPHYTISIWSLHRIFIFEPRQPERANIKDFRLAVNDQFGHELADDRRHLEAVSGKSDSAKGAVQAGQAVNDWVPIGGDGVQSAVAAAPVT